MPKDLGEFEREKLKLRVREVEGEIESLMYKKSKLLKKLRALEKYCADNPTD